MKKNLNDKGISQLKKDKKKAVGLKTPTTTQIEQANKRY